MGLFDVVFGNLPKPNLPVRRRKDVQIAWLNALITGGVGVLYTVFFGNRTANLYFCKHNGQVCYLQAALNDLFDNVYRRIYISDPLFTDPVYVYLIAESEVVWLGMDSEIGTTIYADPLPVYTDTEVGSSVADFVIYVPSALYLVINVHQFKALVDKYRLVNKGNWVVVTF